MQYSPKNLERLRSKVAQYRLTAIPREDSGGKHWYLVPDQSNKIGGFTIGMKKFPSASAILNTFGVHDYVGIDTQVMEEAKNIGTAVHTTIDMVLSGDVGGVVIDDMIVGDIRYQSCMAAFELWYAQATLQTMVTELELVSPKLGYGGTVDWIGWYDGRLTLIDWKTSAEVTFKNFLQLELYALLVKECLGISVDRVILVQLKKQGGEYKVRECPERTQSKRFCRHLLKTYLQLESFKKLVDGRRKMII